MRHKYNNSHSIVKDKSVVIIVIVVQVNFTIITIKDRIIE